MKNLESKQEARVRAAALAWRTLHYIEDHPEKWNQAIYRCGTVACFAGWACTLAGGRWVGLDDQLAADPADNPRHLNANGTINTCMRALRLFGLSGVDHGLFSSDNTLSVLQRKVRALFGPEPPQVA